MGPKTPSVSAVVEGRLIEIGLCALELGSSSERSAKRMRAT